MATQPRLVNKQFNSPIGLYSEQNVKEVIEREKQILSNGAVGVNFYNPNVGKPANLQNSAVLRMLEEEEHRQRSGRAGVKRVAWPPPQEGVLDGPVVEQQAVTAQGGTQHPSSGFQQNSYSQATSQQHQQHQQQSYHSTQHSYQTSQQSYQSRSPLKPLDVSSRGSVSPLNSPVVNQSPIGFRPATPSKQWAPVHSPVQSQGAPQQYQSPSGQYQGQPQYQPVSQQYQGPGTNYKYPGQQPLQEPGRSYLPQQTRSPSQQSQASGQQFQAPGQQFQSPGQQFQSPGQQYQAPGQQFQSPGQQQFQSPGQQYQSAGSQFQSPPSQPQQSQQAPKPVAAPSQAAPRAAPTSKPVDPPPSTITLRPQAPVSQAPPPVFSSQPATATLKGGKHLRGDLKWPPEEVRQRFAEEDRHRIELAKGPANRPKRVDKDYTPFFQAHALNSSYPGYKIPPGTQFYRPE